MPSQPVLFYAPSILLVIQHDKLVDEDWGGWYDEADVEGSNLSTLPLETEGVHTPTLDGSNQHTHQRQHEHTRGTNECTISNLLYGTLLNIAEQVVLTPDEYMDGVRAPYPSIQTIRILAPNNQLFRSILYATPQFWSKISSSMTWRTILWIHTPNGASESLPRRYTSMHHSPAIRQMSRRSARSQSQSF